MTDSMDMGITNSGAFDAVETGVALRPLGWSELCARLTASQDLRQEQTVSARAYVTTGTGIATVPGSFHRAAARMLAAYHPPGQHLREGFINPNSSANRKGRQGSTEVSRETQPISSILLQADENRHD